MTKEIDVERIIEEVCGKALRDEITQGEALRVLRRKIAQVNQETFAKLTKTSRKTISDIENNRGNYSVDTLNRLFKPFGLKLGLVPSMTRLRQRVLS